ncbi:MAG: class I SAM-dependent methyltransferase [Cyanobium sp.]
MVSGENHSSNANQWEISTNNARQQNATTLRRRKKNYLFWVEYVSATWLDRFACPHCTGKLQQPSDHELLCRSCGAAFPMMGRVPIFHSPAKLASILGYQGKESDFCDSTHARFGQDWQYENQYRQQQDPWGYRTRAAEILKYKRLANLCWILSEGTPRRIVDVGCGLGFLALDLAARGARVTAIDLSPTAVLRGEAYRPPGSDEPVFAAASIMAMPLADGSNDLIVIADGFWSWGFDIKTCRAILSSAAAILDKGGKVLFMDYLNPCDQAAFLSLASSPELQLTEIHPLYDRPWYAMELLLQPFRKWRWSRRILENLALARILSVLGRFFGRFGTAHIVVVAEKVRPTNA